MNKNRPLLSGHALIILHTCMPIILLTFVAAAIYCFNISKSDFFLGKYMLFEAIRYVMSSVVICIIGAVTLDIAEYDLKKF